VEVLTKRVSRDLAPRDLIDGIEVRRLRPIGDRSGLGKWLLLPSAFVALLLRARRFDIVCCIDYRGIGLAAVAAGRLLRRPVVFQAGTTGVVSCSNWNLSLARWHVRPDGRLAAALTWPARRSYAAADRYVCISHEIEQEALSVGIPPARVHYLPHGVALERFRPPEPGEREWVRKDEGWPLDRLLCLFVGRLSTEKGILELLEAWRLVDHPGALLVVVGPEMPAHPWNAGPQARRFVADHGLEDRVVLHGPTADPSRLYRTADLFVQPSHFEAFGISVIEAMASGVPVVGSRVGGMLDFLVDGQNALLSEPRSAPDLARQLRRMLDDAALRRRLAEAGHATAVREFDEQKLFDKYAKLLVEVAAARR